MSLSGTSTKPQILQHILCHRSKSNSSFQPQSCRPLNHRCSSASYQQWPGGNPSDKFITKSRNMLFDLRGNFFWRKTHRRNIIRSADGYFFCICFHQFNRRPDRIRNVHHRQPGIFLQGNKSISCPQSHRERSRSHNR